MLKPLEPEELLIDPEDSVLDETLFETLKKDKDGFFANAVGLLTDIFVGKVTREPSASLPVTPAEAAASAGAEEGALEQSPIERELVEESPADVQQTG
jgi:hypothetical protein